MSHAEVGRQIRRVVDEEVVESIRAAGFTLNRVGTSISFSDRRLLEVTICFTPQFGTEQPHNHHSEDGQGA